MCRAVGCLTRRERGPRGEEGSGVPAEFLPQGTNVQKIKSFISEPSLQRASEALLCKTFGEMIVCLPPFVFNSFDLSFRQNANGVLLNDS